MISRVGPSLFDSSRRTVEERVSMVSRVGKVSRVGLDAHRREEYMVP